MQPAIATGFPSPKSFVEHWKPIPNFENFYAISDQGRIRRDADEHNTYVGRILKPKSQGNHSPQVGLSQNGKKTYVLVRHLVALAFLDPCPPGMKIRHKNGDRRDCRLENLEYVLRTKPHTTLISPDDQADPSEIWKPIPGYEEVYSVSDRGRIRRDTSATCTYAGKILKPKPHPNDYLGVTLSKNGQKTDYLIHRLVMLAFVGACPPSMEVNHRDGRPTNNRLENLEYVTASQNMLHSRRVLGTAIGETHYSTTLTNDQVAEIKRLLAQGIANRVLQEQFHVSRGVIKNIRTERTWKSVPAAPTEDFTPFTSPAEPELMFA